MESFRYTLPIATIGGAFTAWLGGIWEPAFFAVGAMLLDFITGMMAGRANEGINSKRAFKGLWKKLGFFAMLIVGFGLDAVFNRFVTWGLSIEIPFDLPIGLIVSAWIIITEAISICENIERLGTPIPPPLLWLLRKTKKNIDDKGDNP